MLYACDDGRELRSLIGLLSADWDDIEWVLIAIEVVQLVVVEPEAIPGESFGMILSGCSLP